MLLDLQDRIIYQNIFLDLQNKNIYQNPGTGDVDGVNYVSEVGRELVELETLESTSVHQF